MRFNTICFLVLLFFKISLLGATQVPNTSSNQENSPSSVQPRFSDPSAMGFPNFGSRRFGNPTSNYPTHSFLPFGNQNNYMHGPQAGYGLGPQNQNSFNNQNRPIQGVYPNQQSYPYQGDSMNPSPNYQEPPYSGSPSDVSMYTNHNHNQGNFENRPIQGSPDQDEYPYQGDTMNPYPNYQQPTYTDQPSDVSMYPGYYNGPYQNRGIPSNQAGHYNWPMPRPGNIDQEFQYHPGSQHNSVGTFQPSNQNIRPYQMNPNVPDDLYNLHNMNIQFPNSLYYRYPNQYYPQTQNNQNFIPNSAQPNSFQSHPINNNPIANVHPSSSYFPKLGIVTPVSNVPSSTTGILNTIPQNQPITPKNKGIAINTGDKEAISVKPVLVSSKQHKVN